MTPGDRRQPSVGREGRPEWEGRIEVRPDEPCDQEPEDEPPGAVLFEIRPRPYLVGWAVVDLAAAAALGAVALLADPSRLGTARLPLALLWLTLPVSSLLGLVVTAFTRLTLPASAGPNPLARWGFGLQLLALGSWVLLAWGMGAGF